MQVHVVDRGVVHLQPEAVRAAEDLDTFHELLQSEGHKQGISVLKRDRFEVPLHLRSLNPPAGDHGLAKSALGETPNRIQRASFAAPLLLAGGSLSAGSPKQCDTYSLDRESDELLSKQISRRQQIKGIVKGLGVIGTVLLFGGSLPEEASATHYCRPCNSPYDGVCVVRGCCGCEFPNWRYVWTYECYDSALDTCVGELCGYYTEFCG